MKKLIENSIIGVYGISFVVVCMVFISIFWFAAEDISSTGWVIIAFLVGLVLFLLNKLDRNRNTKV